jgi:hypothetical protein
LIKPNSAGSKSVQLCVALLVPFVLLAGCAPSAALLPDLSPTPTVALATEAPTPTRLFPTYTPTLPTSTSLPPTDTPSPSPSATPAITATFAILRGQVLEKSNCRYGPGFPYLNFTGLLKGSNLEVIGRREDAQWVYIEAIGGHHPCWVKATQMSILGDLLQLEVYYPEKAPLPKSPYYPPTTIRSATRNGNQIKISWSDIPLRAGDEEDANMLHYIIEVWRCQNGELIFEPLATNDLSISFIDDRGCIQPSHGRIFVQEKHGFAGPTDIPWPPYPGDLTPTP